MEFRTPGTKQELYGKLKTKLGEYVSAGKLPYIKDIHWDDAACGAKAEGPGFKAAIACHDDRITMDLDLGFALKLMKGKIEEMVMKTVSRIFPS